MSHEGKMRRGEWDHSKGRVTDDSKYFLENKPKPKVVDKPKEKTKKAK